MTNGSGKTICQDGNLLTVLAMLSTGCGIKIYDKSPDPSSLNKWLGGQSGSYNSDGSVSLNALYSLGLSQSTSTDITKVKQNLKYAFEVAVRSK